MPFLPVLLVALLFLRASIAETNQGVVESFYRAPLVVLPPSPPLPSHLPPAGRLWTVAWQDEAQGYTLSSSSSSTSPEKRLLAHGMISDVSVNVSGWWQLAISTDIDLDGHEGKGGEYRYKNGNEDAAWMLRRGMPRSSWKVI